MIKRLATLALFIPACPALAAGPVTIDSPMPACKTVADFHTLMTLNDQDRATAARFLREKRASGECGQLKAGKGWVMKDMVFRDGDYACIRNDGEFECLWTVNLGKLQ